MSWAREWLAENLVCPYDRTALTPAGDRLVCSERHQFPTVNRVPVLLRQDLEPTHHIWRTTPADVARLAASTASTAAGGIDPFVERWIVGTCGRLYRRGPRPLPRYPIPEIDLPPGREHVLLDVGSNWGRWSLAAARAGYRVVAVDPSLEAALAGVRIARQLDLRVAYVVGDARALPFRTGSFDVGYSNGVFQHLDKAIVREALTELGRVTRIGGTVKIQMANVLGPLRLFIHSREALTALARTATGRRKTPYRFRVRAWTPRELMRTFRAIIGPAKLSADSYFSLGARATDVDLVTPARAVVIRASHALCAASTHVPGMPYVADSVTLEAVNQQRS